MNNRYHIIITGESGRSTALQLSKRKLAISLSAALALLAIVCVVSYFTTGAYFNSRLLAGKVKNLKEELEVTEKSNCDYEEQIAGLKKRHRETLAQINQEHVELVSSQKLDYETQIADQKVTFDLETTNLQLENVRLMNTAVNDLAQRSELIESVMGTIGVELKKPSTPQGQKNSGGPFIPDSETSFNDLIKTTDNYLKLIRAMPLGRPTEGRISSKFGKRTDPVNKKKAIHEGVDIKGKKGQRILATGSGKVIKAMQNGGYGNYVEIDHGNGYITAFAHMQNYLVKKGEFIEQGQVIGQVGSTGRSTGPHLHYEIRLKKKPINPDKFMKIADISHTFKSIPENQ